VWRLDRWGRSVADLVSTLQELQHLGVGFVSLTEALDLTTPALRLAALGLDWARRRCQTPSSTRREWQALFWHNTSGSEGTVRVTRPGFTERRILPPFVRYGLMTQSASSVRGSSRRIMTMRFRPADIRVINRRTRLCSCHPLRAFPGRASPGLLTTSPHIRS